MATARTAGPYRPRRPERTVLYRVLAQHYNRVRPHSSLGYRPPAPEATWLKPAALRSAGFNQPLSAPSY